VRPSKTTGKVMQIRWELALGMIYLARVVEKLGAFILKFHRKMAEYETICSIGLLNK